MRLLVAGALVLAALVLTGCSTTGSPRCDDRLPAQIMSVAEHGGSLRCDPSYDSDEPASARMIVQWNRSAPIVWLWERRLADDELRLLARIGDGEIVARARGMVPASYEAGVPAAAAIWAAHYAYCREVIPGVGAPGYFAPPEGCSSYL